MKRVAVSSSSVATVGYDPSSFILEIEFRKAASTSTGRSLPQRTGY